MNELQRNLRNQNAITYSVQEFRGAREFYEQRKLSPDVNILRSFHFMTEFIQVARDDRTQFILADRGLYDSLCWLEWFAASGVETSKLSNIVRNLIEIVPTFASKYRIIWMDRDPLAAIRNHGRNHGRIVNFANLSSLQEIYASRFRDLQLPGTFHRVDSDEGSATQIAGGLVSSLKLV